MLIKRKSALGGIIIEQLRPSSITLYQTAGFDFIYLETEDVIFDPPALTDFILSARDQQIPIIAKVPDLQRQWVAYLLDAGVAGLRPETATRPAGAAGGFKRK